MINQGKNNGFTLLELIVTVAIISIVSSIAYPSYQQYLVRANRAAAQQFLLEAASIQHQYFLANNGNGYATQATLIGASGLLSTPSSISSYYEITVDPTTGATSSSFTIIATPLTNSIQQNDGYLSIANTGLKTGAW